MSDLAIFVLGVVVTAIVAVAVAPLLWAAVLDGRYDRERRQLAVVRDDGTPPDRRAA